MKLLLLLLLPAFSLAQKIDTPWYLTIKPIDNTPSYGAWLKQKDKIAKHAAMILHFGHGNITHNYWYKPDSIPIKKADTAKVTYFAKSGYRLKDDFIVVVRYGYRLSYKGELVIYLRPDGLKEENFIQLIKEGW